MRQPTVIAHSPDCPGGNCPTTYKHPDPLMTYVQGTLVTDPEVLASLNIPAGEAVLAVPNALLADHVRAVQA